MKLRIESDIHLEFYNKKEYLLEKTEDESDCILILAGDICPASYISNNLYFFKDVVSRFKSVIYVPGNHEYYGGNITFADNTIMEFFKDHDLNITFLNNNYTVIDDITFIGSSLWGDYDGGNPITLVNAGLYMNDHHVIKIGERYAKFSPENAYEIHNKSKGYIKQFLENSETEKTVVITHHAPSRRSIHENYHGNSLNGAYASSIEELMLDYRPVLWVHGHIHEPVDYENGRTRVISNPKGYPGEAKESIYRPVVIEI